LEKIYRKINSNPIRLLTFSELFRRLMSSAIQLITLTNQEETPLSHRKARIINNHVAQLNAVLAGTLRQLSEVSKVQACSHRASKKQTKLSNKRGINSSWN